MPEASDVEIFLVLQDPEADAEGLEDLTQSFYDQLQDLAEQVDRVAAADLPADSAWVPKGDKTESGILDIKINLDKIQALMQWLYQRLVGTSIKAEFAYKTEVEEVSFKVEGRNQQELQTTIQQFEDFIKNREAVRRVNQS